MLPVVSVKRFRIPSAVLKTRKSDRGNATIADVREAILNGRLLLPGLVEQYLSRIREQEHLNAFRSEEHTSELQSLMRNSYAVFCLKKKKNKNNSIQDKQNE